MPTKYSIRYAQYGAIVRRLIQKVVVLTILSTLRTIFRAPWLVCQCQINSCLAGQDVGVDSRTLHAPFGTDIKTDDMITIDGIDYKVLSPYGEKTIQVFTSVVILRKTPL